MLFKTIKQNLAGFAAVAIAFTGLTAIAPAHAVGTSLTTSDVARTSVNRANVSLSGNSLTITATVGADELLRNLWADADFAENANPLAIQAGDQIKATAVYTNLTDNSTLTFFSNYNADYDGFNNTTSTNVYGNSSGQTTGNGNTLTRTVTLTNMTAGSYTRASLSQNFSITDPSITAGDNVRMVVSYWLVRSGVETALTLRTSVGSSSNMYFDKVGVLSHTIGATDTAVNVNADFCIYRGENGIGFGDQVQITFTNSGTAGAFDNVYANGNNYAGGGSISTTGSGATRTLTLPASGWDVVSVYANAYRSNSLTVGQTVVPVVTAVKAGTSTNVLDTCSRKITVGTAPTVTPGASTVDVSWSIPSLPIAGTWDTIRVLACDTALNTCGDYSRMMGYFPGQVFVQSYTNRSSGMISNTATAYTVASNNMSTMPGPGQMQASPAWSASGTYKYFVVFEDFDSPFFAVTAVSAAATTTGGGNQVVQNNTPSVSVVPTTIPLVRPTLALSQTVRAGGTLVIDAANAASVSEIKVGGVAAKLEKVTAGVEIQVPTGLTPGAKDLFIKTDTGSTLHVGAIKIADPIVEAAKLAYAKAASTVAFRAPIDQAVAGARPSAKQVAEARAHAVEYKTAKEAVCVAVPASKATASSARAAATALCAAMKSVNRKLKVTIIVEAPSGARTNVISSELIG